MRSREEEERYEQLRERNRHYWENRSFLDDMLLHPFVWFFCIFIGALAAHCCDSLFWKIVAFVVMTLGVRDSVRKANYDLEGPSC